MPDKREAKRSLQRHRSQIGVSAEAYRAKKLTAFSRAAVDRKSVYLDVNYWIDLQRASEGRARRPEFDVLLATLRQGVSAKALFCPPTLGLFMEVGKQRGLESRRKIGQLIDEFSDGIGLAADDDIVGLEAANMLDAVLNERSVKPPRNLIWTPLGCMSAALTPPPLPFVRTRQEQCRIEKSYFDTLMDATAEELLEIDAPDNRKAWADLAQEITEGSAAHAHEFKSFEELLHSELWGASQVAARMIQSGTRANFNSGLPTDPEGLARVMFLTLRADERARRAVPSLYVRAGLHALVRWNRTQKFKPNDVYDFGHAAAALGYCDLFLTEGPLRDLLGRGPLRLADASSCVIVADPAKAIEAVADLTSPSSKLNDSSAA